MYDVRYIYVYMLRKSAVELTSCVGLAHAHPNWVSHAIEFCWCSFWPCNLKYTISLLSFMTDIISIVLLSCFGELYSVCCNLMQQPGAMYRWTEAKVLNQQVSACSSQKNHTSMRMSQSWSLLIYCARARSCVNKTGYLQIAEGYPSS